MASETPDPELTDDMRELLKAHHEAILRELNQSREDTRRFVAEMREDQRKDIADVNVRLDGGDERTRKIENRLGYLGALYLMGLGALALIAEKVFR